MKQVGFLFILLGLFFLFPHINYGQTNGLVNTRNSPHAQLYSIGATDVEWTNGFWAERYDVCKNTMVPHMMKQYMDAEISHAYANFEIAAGLREGAHVGPPFHDGDFFKILEALIMVNAIEKSPNADLKLDSIITVIGMTQREDGYIHTPVVIAQKANKNGKKEFGERLDFETYNMGHLMTAACLHFRTTGKEQFLDIAIRATDFLYKYYQEKPEELAQNAICPSHYMGVIEMYRTTKNKKYLELAKGLIDIRSTVKEGTDHNQDRIPFKQQSKAVGHAVRANYLYAGAADVYAETGEDSLFSALDAIWHDLKEKKLYITGACGALYDGVSPKGTSYDPSFIQQVHQAYGQDYELPNLDAHNESCANIGNLMWNWRMLSLTADAQYADMIEQVAYNSLLAGVSLDGKGYFYTNPLAVSRDVSYELRWSKQREEYISYCNCCPPNTIRTISEMHNYFYNISNRGLWINLYGGNKLATNLADGSELKLEQATEYPWDGQIHIEIQKSPRKEFSLFLRIPAWCEKAAVSVNERKLDIPLVAGSYAEISRKWKKGDVLDLELEMPAVLVQSHPLVEANNNQAAVMRGPLVYCMESADLSHDSKMEDVLLPVGTELITVEENIAGSKVMTLQGSAMLKNGISWERELYQKIGSSLEKHTIKLIPYYAWGNRAEGDMKVWIPVSW